MIKFTTEQLYWLHDQLKGTFLKKKNVPTEIQKFYYHITTQLLKQGKEEENLSNIKYKDYFKPTEKQIENEKKLEKILETNGEEIEKSYNKRNDTVFYLGDEDYNVVTPAFYSTIQLEDYIDYKKINRRRYRIYSSSLGEYKYLREKGNKNG